MTETRLIANSIEDNTYFQAIQDVVSYLDKDGNGIQTLKKRIKEIKEEKNDTETAENKV